MPNNNPSGKGGFKDNPDHVNKEGRPHESWAKSLREVGETVHEKTGKKYKELVSASIWQKALMGDLSAMKLLMERTDGMPKQSVELSGDDENPVRIDISATLRKVYGQKIVKTTRRVPKNGK